TLIAAYSALPDDIRTQGPSLSFTWAYPLDLTHVTAFSLDDLTQRAETIDTQGTSDVNGIAGLNLFVSSNLREALREFQLLVIIAQIPVVLLLIQVLGLVLLFISLMVNILIDRQIDAIAVLRSRGASRGLVLRVMTAQSIGVGLLALVGGPLLAILLVRVVGELTLPSADREVLALLSGNPLALAWNVRWFALTAAVCAVVAMVFSTR